MPSSEKFISQYDLNYFREKRLGDKVQVVTFTGSFEVLTDEEYGRLVSKRLTPALFERFSKSGLIVTEANEAGVAESYKKKKQQLFQGTSLHIVVVTLRCNENCIYCHAASRPETAAGYDMDVETARKTVDFIFQTPTTAITIEFQGGEPLLNYGVVKEIVAYAQEKNKKANKSLYFSVVTNLSLMDDEKLAFFISNNVGICTSLDGPKFLHDKNRPMGTKSSYDETVKWIKKIKESKNNTRDVNALVSVTKFSLPYAREIVDEYRRLGIRKVWFRQLNNLGCAASSWNKIAFSAEEYLEFWKKGLDYVYEKKDIREMSSEIILKKVLGDSDPLLLDLMSPCGAGIGQLAYNYEGDIYSCDEARMLKDDMFKLGNVFKNTYKEVLTCPKTCSLIAASVNECYACDLCLYQPYCGLCPVTNYAQTGSMIPNLSADMRCKILKGQFEHILNKLVSEPGFRDWAEKNIPVKSVKHEWEDGQTR